MTSVTNVSHSMAPVIGFGVGSGVGATVGLATFMTGLVVGNWPGIFFLSPWIGTIGGAVGGALLGLLYHSGMQIKESMNNAPNKSILEHIFSIKQTKEGMITGDAALHPL